MAFSGCKRHDLARSGDKKIFTGENYPLQQLIFTLHNPIKLGKIYIIEVVILCLIGGNTIILFYYNTPIVII